MGMLRQIVQLCVVICLCFGASAQERVLPQSQQEVLISFSPIVKKATPAVVNIYTKRKVKVRNSLFFNDPLFQHFFGNKFGGPVTEKVESSLGSGVLVNSDGLIVTCHHVIEGSDEVRVVLHDKREFDAEIVLLDPKTDLAILQIDTAGEALAYLPLMDSDNLEVGDIVLAVGNPFGIGQTVTNGIVSALARTTVGVSDYQFFIQTDASINPGNSGGALVNLNGELVGINSAIYSRSGGSNGVGFAVPSNMVRTVIKNASGFGRVVRPWLGVKMQTVTADIANSLNLPRPTGVLVAEIDERGAAQAAGLRVGDVILRLDDVELQDGHALNYRIATYDVGKESTLVVLRDGKERNIVVRMTAPPEAPERDIKVLEGNHPLVGATIANISPALADEIGIDTFKTGVVLMANSGIAAKLGFKAKDIIRAVNDKKVHNTVSLAALLNTPQPAWKITIERGNRLLNIIWRR